MSLRLHISGICNSRYEEQIIISRVDFDKKELLCERPEIFQTSLGGFVREKVRSFHIDALSPIRDTVEDT
ncbi:hypothetical protein [Echinicola arenosa]|uniref:hypothetical protein n=1 Tax=Echinicola arenosa TaxID=2774144 RepID=UPI00177BDD90|nr:hypothetical protein [Echinicola arenosa]